MRKLCGTIFVLLLGFFAGVICTLVVLAPGDRSLSDAVRDGDLHAWADFNRAGDRVEAAGDTALLYAFKIGQKTGP
ncbi:MAG: hypothetical protein JW709_12685 [Sedimentisphaerales bacterium]|nr:hypothetical protein [Sedimentisphaerales bacterium]